MKINTPEFTETLAAEMGVTVSATERFLKEFISLVYWYLQRGDTVNLTGFGQFSVSHRRPRLGVNPRNPSERITVPELNTPKFKAGEAFKGAVSYTIIKPDSTGSRKAIYAIPTRRL